MLKSAGRFLLYIYENKFCQTIFFSGADSSSTKIKGYANESEHRVENYLMNIGYHRLSAYIYPCYKSPKRDLVLKEGTAFEQVLTLYRFDKKLRIFLFNEIEKIEVSIRSVGKCRLPRVEREVLDNQTGIFCQSGKVQPNFDDHRKGISFKQGRLH